MSGIQYGAPVHRSKTGVQSKALTNFKSICESYENDGTSILSEGILDVLRNPSMFNEYVERLTEGCSEEMRNDMAVLAENTRLDMLTESSISGINPIAALSLPILRVGFPKLAVREGLPTEPVEQPLFKVIRKRPYVRKASTGEKVYLPAALLTETFGLPQLQITSINATSGIIADYDLLAPIGKNAELGDEIDIRFAVTEVVLRDSGDLQPAVTVATNIELDANTNVLNARIAYDETTDVTFFGTVDRAKGLLSAAIAATGVKLISIKIVGFVSSESNNAATQIGFDMEGIDCNIGTGQPIESPINIQQMTDVMNMYQVDSTLSHLETMTTVLAHTTDREGLSFIKTTFDRLPTANKIVETFSVVPPDNYALGDAAWREQLKIKLDRLVTRMQMDTNIYSGHAVVFCNPLDAQVISNVKWVYAATEQVNDVAVDFKVGNYVSSVTSYTVLQSPYFQQGEIYVVYVPSDAEHKTLTYFPYSFNTIRGAASPNSNSVNLPTIQMIKRHLFKAFTPMVAKMTITGNGVV